METILLTCAYCGSKLEPNEENLKAGTCKCKYCLSTVVIPKNLSQIENWFNRAVELRRNGEFDKAIDAYEKILMEEPADPEAHWGLALSRNGIEFVDDPHSGDRIPTCHRTKPQTILSDAEYLAAVKYAEAPAKAVIEAEAQRIHKIQKKIIEVSSQEPPYDVFISYKELDNYGQRTADSVLAQEIYNELIKKGCKVFFARKTLEGKLGQEYEPIIYAALNSAKVMVVVGTRPDHFEAVWVRNEWRRFQLMGETTEKTIIPVFRNMPAERLPSELSSYVALDMGKLGGMQDLTDGIEKCLKKKSNYASGNRVGRSETSDGADELFDRAETCLRLKDDSVAKQHFTTMTKKFPGDYRGWWGLIRCVTDNFKTVVTNRELLSDYYRKVHILLEENPSLSQEIEKTYSSYLEMIAEKNAREDLAIVKGKRQHFLDNARSAEQKVIAFNEELQGAIDEDKNAEQAEEEQRQDIHEKREEWVKKYHKLAYIGFIIALAGTLCFTISANSGWWVGYLIGTLAIVLGGLFVTVYHFPAMFSGFILLVGQIVLTVQIRGSHPIVVGAIISAVGLLLLALCALKKTSNQNMWSSSEEYELKKVNEQAENRKVLADQKQSDIRSQLQLAESRVTQNRRQADAYNDFLSLPEEQIKNYWYSILLQEINISRELDTTVVGQLRKRINL